MIGDSITEQHLYSTYVELWTITRFPEWKITFRNVGISGDRSPGGNYRFKRDVLALDPTALTVDFGMNDGNYGPFNEVAYQIYMKGLKGIARQAKTAKIRVAWITPSPFEKDELGDPLLGYNQTLEKFSAGVKEIAESKKGLFIDQFHPFLRVQGMARKEAAGNRIGGGDPIHPGPPGQTVMAWAILKGMRFPTLVSTVEIDAAAGKVEKAAKCKVTRLKASTDRVRFERQDEALPFFPETAASILKWVPIHDELNDYRLRVKGLKAGSYEVRLGGKKIATYSAAELAKGVNLAGAALTQGPVADQVRAVVKAVKAKNDYFHNRIFLGVILAGGAPDFLNIPPPVVEAKRRAAFKERMARMPELDAAIRKALIIKPHTVEIVAAGRK
jgi:lysophospholipase L1-like esterase